MYIYIYINFICLFIFIFYKSSLCLVLVTHELIKAPITGGDTILSSG